VEQQLHDAEEEKQLAEKKGNAVMKDLRRQLAAERKRSEKLQERMRDHLNEGTHFKTGNLCAYSGYKRNCKKFSITIIIRKGDSFLVLYISSHPSANPLSPYVAMLFSSFSSQKLVLCLKYFLGIEECKGFVYNIVIQF
jgi:hypothetical protein